MRKTIQKTLRQMSKRALKSPKTTAAGLAALVTLFAPHVDSARILAIAVFVLGLLSQDADTTDADQ